VTTNKKKVESSFDMLDQYINYIQAVKERSPLTVSEYRYDLTMFFRFFKRDRKRVDLDTPFNQIDISDISLQDLKSVTIDDLYVFMIYLSRERKASAATRARKTATLKSFFKFLFQKKKCIPSDPAYELESPKVGRRLPKYLNLDDSINLLNVAHASSHKTSLRDFCMLTLFLNCGMRLSELRGINNSDMHENTLRVIGKGNKERTIYLNRACLESIDAYRVERNALSKIIDKDALFLSRTGRRLSHQMIQYTVKKRLAESGIDTNVYSVHKLRHTAATLMYKYGRVDIRSLQSILGHSSVATTQIYTHVDDDSLHKAIESNPLAQFTPDMSDR